MAEKRSSTSRRSPPSKAAGAAAAAKRRPAAKSTNARPTGKTPKKVTARGAKSAKVAKSARAAAGTRDLAKVVQFALDEMKAVQVKVLDVRKLTDIADTLIIASGNSDRHVRSISEKVVEEAKKAGFRPMGVEGQRDGEWVLVDLQDVVVHIMLPRVRELYRLENLWDVSAARRDAAVGE